MSSEVRPFVIKCTFNKSSWTLQTVTSMHDKHTIHPSLKNVWYITRFKVTFETKNQSRLRSKISTNETNNTNKKTVKAKKIFRSCAKKNWLKHCTHKRWNMKNCRILNEDPKWKRRQKFGSCLKSIILWFLQTPFLFVSSTYFRIRKYFWHFLRSVSFRSRIQLCEWKTQKDGEENTKKKIIFTGLFSFGLLFSVSYRAYFRIWLSSLGLRLVFAWQIRIQQHDKKSFSLVIDIVGMAEWRLATKYDSIFFVHRKPKPHEECQSGIVCIDFQTGSLHNCQVCAHRSDCQQCAQMKRYTSHGCNLNARIRAQTTTTTTTGQHTTSSQLI